MLVYCANNCETIVGAEVIDWALALAVSDALSAVAWRLIEVRARYDGAPNEYPNCKGSGYQLVSI
jgi:hypothetical protein